MFAIAALAALTLAQPAAGQPPAERPPALSTQPRNVPDPASPAVVGGASGPVLTLEQALAEAGERNQDLAQARARYDQAATATAQAWAGYLPQVTAGASYTRNSAASSIQIPVGFAVQNGAVVPTQVIEAEIQKKDQLAAQVEATQALVAPPLWWGVPAARASVRAAEAGTEDARRQILFGVAQAYYGAVAGKQAIAVQERQVSIAREHEKDARVRFEAGTVPKITLLRAEIDRARAEQDLKRAQNQLASTKAVIATLVDRPDAAFDVEIPKPPAPPADAAALEDAARRDRPDVRAAEETLRAAEARRGSVRAEYLPVLGAFGRYQITNTEGFSGDKDAWAVGLQLGWNLFDGGLREARLREAGARVSEAQASRRQADLRAVEEVRTARFDLDSALANRAKAEEQVALARENQRLVEVNFRAGAATYLEVSDANTALANAELAAITEDLNAGVASLRLQLASGAFAAR